ncbi:hypothetical protein FRC16_007849 [Serendipita sp. 398]|nr:hypothetical protein FRC16_007849 [Serendipita sp. 398]
MEIEDLIMCYPVPTGHPGTNTVLIMCSSDRTCNQIREFLSSMDPTAKPGSKGRKFMESRLRSYLFWKGKLGQEGKRRDEGDSSNNGPNSAGTSAESGMSEALKRKDARMKERQGSRRRVRGGPPGSAGASSAAVERSADQSSRSGAMGGEGVIKEEAEELATFLDGVESTAIDMPDLGLLTQMALEADDFDEHYGLVQPEHSVVVRSYSDDTDDRVLSEIKPRFIIMYEPKLDFVRRIEVYRSSTPGLAVRVYVTMWDTSAEEDMYLAELRREKDAFESLIRERSNMVLVIQEKPSATQARTDALIRTISTRNAGGATLEMGKPLVRYNTTFPDTIL